MNQIYSAPALVLVLNSWFWALVAVPGSWLQVLGQIQVLGLDQQEIQAELRIPWERICERNLV